jgi:hypothetical protein
MKAHISTEEAYREASEYASKHTEGHSTVPCYTVEYIRELLETSRACSRVYRKRIHGTVMFFEYTSEHIKSIQNHIRGHTEVTEAQHTVPWMYSEYIQRASANFRAYTESHITVPWGISKHIQELSDVFRDVFEHIQKPITQYRVIPKVFSNHIQSVTEYVRSHTERYRNIPKIHVEYMGNYRNIFTEVSTIYGEFSSILFHILPIYSINIQTTLKSSQYRAQCILELQKYVLEYSKHILGMSWGPHEISQEVSIYILAQHKNRVYIKGWVPVSNLQNIGRFCQNEGSSGKEIPW